MATTVKEEARRLVELLPDDVDWAAIADAFELRRKIERGLADIEAGRGVAHDEVMRHLGIRA